MLVRKRPCTWCGAPISPGWSNHRCPEADQAMKDLRAAAGIDDEPEHVDEAAGEA